MGFRHNFLIGLGGTGGAALKACREIAVERQGEYQNLLQQRHRFEYLYLDSNAVDVACATQWKHHGQHIGLVQGTQSLLLSLPKNVTAEEICKLPQVAPWIGENGVASIEKMFASPALGASQMRRYGRVLAAVNAGAIRNCIESGIHRLSEDMEERDRYVSFHVFASAGGGTGSGCLVDVLTLLPQLCNVRNIRCKTYLYLFVGGSEAQHCDTGLFYLNEYAALRDVNALMVNKLHPCCALLAGAPFHQVPYPVVATCISTGDNLMSLSEQVESCAASCLELIFASGIDSTVGRAMIGMDVYPLFPGEVSVVESNPFTNQEVVTQHLPDREALEDGCERSYRFRTMSRTRFKLPSDTLAEPSLRELRKSSLDAEYVNRLLADFNESLSVSGARTVPGINGGNAADDGLCFPQSVSSLFLPEAVDVTLEKGIKRICKERSRFSRDPGTILFHSPEMKEASVLFLEYMLPLRFFCVTEYLDKCYKKAQDEGLTEALYYANIDDAGMLDPSPDRPDLLPEFDPIKHTAREELRKQLQEKNTH